MQSKDEVHAVIDLGTNTCLLLIGSIQDGIVKKIFELQEIPRIGRDLFKTGRISRQAFDDTALIFEKYIYVSKKYSVEKVHAFGTSALRDAENSEEFIRFIYEKTGVLIRVISGSEESTYSYEGATFDLNREFSYAVLDIGGGSTELSTGRDGRIEAESVNIGSVRLCEEYFDGQFNAVNISKAENYIASEITRMKLSVKGTRLIGVAGTATTLSAIKNNLKVFDEKIIDKDVLSDFEIRDLILKLSAMTPEERINLGDYMKGRGDIIICGAIIMKEVMRRFGITEIMIRTTGLRYGLLLNSRSFN